MSKQKQDKKSIFDSMKKQKDKFSVFKSSPKKGLEPSDDFKKKYGLKK